MTNPTTSEFLSVQRFCLLLVGLIWHSFSYSQSFLPDPNLFTSLEFEIIYQSARDDRGFLWLTTNKGLFCFDGTQFRKVQHTANGPSAVDNGQVNHMLFDENRQEIWMATSNGVSVLDLQTERFLDYSVMQEGNAAFTSGNCLSVAKDVQGNIWLSIQGLGIARYDSTFQYFPIQADSGSLKKGIWPSFEVIAQDPREDSILWLIPAPNGIMRFNTSTGHATLIKKENIAEPWRGFLISTALVTEDKIFMGEAYRDYCHIFDLKSRTFKEAFNTNPNYPGQPMRWELIQPRSPSTFWAYDRFNLYVFDMEADSLLYRLPKPASEKSFAGGFIASEEGLWVGSENGLLFYNLHDYKVENHNLREAGEEYPIFLTSALENENRLLLAFLNSHYLYDYDPETRKVKKISLDDAEARPPHRLMRLRNGNILAISENALYEYREGRLVNLPIFREIAEKSLGYNDPAEDSQGNLWLSTAWGGVYKLDLERETFRDYVEDLGLRGIFNMFIDRDDNVWMTWRNAEGFMMYHAQQDSIYTFPFQAGAEKTVYYPNDFEQDEAGYIWMSDSRIGGLMKIDPQHPEQGILERYVAAGNAQSNNMYALQFDTQGRIWAVTRQGLQVFDTFTHTFRLFGEAVGFRLRGKNRINSNFIPPYLTRLSSGEMLVGYRDGFAIFHPDSLLAINSLPRPYLLSLKVEDQPIKGVTLEEPPPFELKHSQNMLEFEFSATDWYDAKKLRFAYRLLGLSDRWTETQQRNVRFVNLPPKAYTFELHAMDALGERYAQPLRVSFRIRPPWWATWWAYTLYVLLAGAALWGAFEIQRRRWKLQSKLAMEQREAERLKELDATKNRLYTNITHEFRTPLTIILGMAKQVREHPKESLKEGLEMIIRNGHNLLQLVNQMLDLSKLESGALPLDFIQGDIVGYLKYLLESFHSLAETKDIRLHFQAECETLVMDYDPRKVQEIVSNLLSNAIKFTPEGGEVFFSAGIQEGTLRLQVRDTGVGIAKDALPRIFDRFYQGDDSSTRHAEGTGIGLALTRELVKLLQGEISAESEAGQGTTFTVLLPIRREAPMGEPVPIEKPASAISTQEVNLIAANPVQAGLPLLLVVEDNQDVQRYLHTLLKSHYQLAFASDGQEGWDKTLELTPDLLLSDVMMPRMDGFELCRRVKTDLRTSHIPVVLLTAKADQKSKISGLQQGADAYLQKPFDKAELFTRLEKLHEIRQQIQAHYAGHNPLAEVSESVHPLEDAFLAQIRVQVEAHLDDDSYGIDELCLDIGMSRSQLHRKLKALTGRSTTHYINSIRLAHAMQLLKTTDLNISEVAYSVGFRHPTYFSRLFQEEFGMKPSELKA